MAPKDYSIKIGNIELSTVNIPKEGIKVSDLDSNTARLLSVFNNDSNKEVLSKQEIKNAILYFKSFDNNIQDSNLDEIEQQALVKSMQNKTDYMFKTEKQAIDKEVKEFVKHKNEFIQEEGEKRYNQILEDFIFNKNGIKQHGFTEYYLKKYKQLTVHFQNEIKDCPEQYRESVKQHFELELAELREIIKHELRDTRLLQELSEKEKDFWNLFILDKQVAIETLGQEAYEEQLANIKNQKVPNDKNSINNAISDLSVAMDRTNEKTTNSLKPTSHKNWCKDDEGNHYKFNPATRKFEKIDNVVYVDKNGNYRKEIKDKKTGRIVIQKFTADSKLSSLYITNYKKQKYTNPEFVAKQLGMHFVDESASFYSFDSQEAYYWKSTGKADYRGNSLIWDDKAHAFVPKKTY